LEEKGREGKTKKEEISERSREVWGGNEFRGLFFVHNTKTPQFGGTQKLY
jgi:hypothetical protein